MQIERITKDSHFILYSCKFTIKIRKEEQPRPNTCRNRMDDARRQIFEKNMHIRTSLTTSSFSACLSSLLRSLSSCLLLSASHRNETYVRSRKDPVAPQIYKNCSCSAKTPCFSQKRQPRRKEHLVFTFNTLSPNPVLPEGEAYTPCRYRNR